MLSLNGQLLTSPAEELVSRMHAASTLEPMPREIVMELSTGRRSDPSSPRSPAAQLPAQHCKCRKPKHSSASSPS